MSLEMSTNVMVDTIELMKSLFINEEDDYALQMADGSYRRIKSPVTNIILHQHLSGQITIGTYLLNRKSEVKFLVIDIDEYTPSETSVYDMKIENHPVVGLLSGRFDHFGIPMAIEFSGKKGFHLWTPLSEQTPAGIIRSIALGIVDEIREDLPESVSIEIFPKQDVLSSPESLGNLIKLPLGIHRVTGLRSCFCDSELHPYSDGNGKLLAAQIEYLKNIPKLSIDHIKELASQFSQGNEISPSHNGGKTDCFNFINTKDPIQNIYANCEKIRELRTKAVQEKKLTYEERRNFASIFAHVPGGEEEIHTVMKYCMGYEGKGNYNKRFTQAHIDNIKQHLRPVTCAQLCGCKNIRNRGKGGSPIAFAFNQNQTAHLKLSPKKSNTIKGEEQ